MTMREKIARAIAAQKMGLSNRGERLPDDLWAQALPCADAVLDAMCEPTEEMTQYMILSEETRIELSRAVERAIKEGWRPQGGVSFDTNRKEFLQAMVKG